MTDVDPKIWENPTLGSVGAGPFLDEVEAQAKEDLNARRDGREPRTAFHVDRYPKFMEPSVPSNVTTLEMLEPGEPLPVGENSVPSPVEEEENEITFDFEGD